MQFLKEYLSFFTIDEEESALHFFRCKYIVLTEEYDLKINLSSNPWLHSDSNKNAKEILKRIQEEALKLIFKFNDKYLIDDSRCPISYKAAKEYYETRKHLWETRLLT